jgi:hypothetical protein
MMKTFIAIAAVAMLASSSTWADDFPFVGKWNCGVAEFTFTNLTAYNGSETYPILKVEKATQSGFRSEKGAMSYRLEFQKGYAFSLLNIKAKTMTWHLLASGDTFSCKRKAGTKK